MNWGELNLPFWGNAFTNGLLICVLIELAKINERLKK